MMHARNRRTFLKASMATVAPGLGLIPEAALAADSNLNIIGPRDGYSPHIGTLVSMLTWMRTTVLGTVKGLTQKDLDYLQDSKANTIGALLLHLAATDAYYHLHTFEGKKWGSWNDQVKLKWDDAMNLGEPARKSIKGHDLSYYLDALQETREKTLAEFRKRDDKWLMTIENGFGSSPTNYYCEWFHVCEHESNHNGQIKFLGSRLPGAKADNG